jgi:hypothetical protein
MAATPLFTCRCGVQRQTSNHWILAICTSHDVRFLPWDCNLAMDEHVIVLCGERCAAALLSRSLGGWQKAEFSSVSAADIRDEIGSYGDAMEVAQPVRA